ncbi:hypothetical protein L596_006497 [Steinernema carpocapsae]|uniref:Adenosine deaminase n=1 Tax=Steinernema carpocapsae TaxID=34508 RepID=A0A4U8V2C2_STECR|nr:hypothetical protein L596_006497 [Steinernema carpocapsae]
MHVISSPVVSSEDFETLNFPKVELHLHLDGSIRYRTILDLAQAKHIDLKGAKTVEDVKKLVVTHTPASLSKVLAAFEIFLPCVTGDAEAIERIAYELCEDQAKNGVVYFETRYSPHLLSSTANHNHALEHLKDKLCPRGVVEAVKRGLDRGSRAFDVKANSILCCIRGFEDWNHEVLELATFFKDKGVVGIDVAGCAHGADEQYEPSVIAVFQEAARRGINRTVHAGESGGPKEVVTAIDTMKAQRIGHGYRLVHDEAAYQKYAVEKHTHLEGCPYSSIMTGAVPLDWPNHPIRRWVKDRVNFSLSTDDPTCFDNSMMSELVLARKELGLTVHQLWQCQYNAAEASFLPPSEKKQLLVQIIRAEPDEDPKH